MLVPRRHGPAALEHPDRFGGRLEPQGERAVRAAHVGQVDGVVHVEEPARIEALERALDEPTDERPHFPVDPDRVEAARFAHLTQASAEGARPVQRLEGPAPGLVEPVERRGIEELCHLDPHPATLEPGEELVEAHADARSGDRGLHQCKDI